MEEILRSNEVNRVTMVEFFLHHSGPISLYYLQIEKIRTSPYHLQSNGQVERVHQTLLRMIGKLEEDKHRDWPTHLGSVVHAYNATRSLVTGFSPHYLMFGR